jgi:hypothetical protein
MRHDAFMRRVKFPTFRFLPCTEAGACLWAMLVAH